MRGNLWEICQSLDGYLRACHTHQIKWFHPEKVYSYGTHIDYQLEVDGVKKYTFLQFMSLEIIENLVAEYLGR